MAVLALQLASPDVPDVIGALSQRERSPTRDQPAEAPRVRYVGGQPSSEAAAEVARRIQADRAAGKAAGIQGTPEGRAWLMGD